MKVYKKFSVLLFLGILLNKIFVVGEVKKWKREKFLYLLKMKSWL